MSITRVGNYRNVVNINPLVRYEGSLRDITWYEEEDEFVVEGVFSDGTVYVHRSEDLDEAIKEVYLELTVEDSYEELEIIVCEK